MNPKTQLRSFILPILFFEREIIFDAKISIYNRIMNALHKKTLKFVGATAYAKR